jgi:hypothetical protein
MVDKFLILQNSNTKQTLLYTNKGGWIEADEDEFEAIGLLASLIRTSPDDAEDILKTLSVKGRDF